MLIAHALGAAPAVAASVPVLDIVESRNGLLTLACGEPQCTRTFEIVSAQSTAVDVRVVGSPTLADEGGKTVSAKMSPVSGRIAPFEALKVNVTAELPDPGEYKGTVTVLVGTKLAARALLTMKRELRPAAVEIVGINPVSISTDQGDPSIRFELRELGGAPTEVPRPVLASLVGAHDHVQTDTGTVTVLRNGQPTTPTMRLDRNETAPLVMRISGLRTAGEYTATVRVAPEGTKAVEATASIFVRRAAAVAGVWIGVGVLLGFLLRFYRTHLRPQLLVKRREEELRASLGVLDTNDLDSDEGAIWRGMLAQLDLVAARIWAIPAEQSAERLEAIDAKQRLFVIWRRERQRIDVIPIGSWDDFVIQAQAKVRAARQTLESSTAKAADADAQSTAIGDVGTQVLVAAKRHLVDLFSQLATEVGSDLVHLPLAPLQKEIHERAGTIQSSQRPDEVAALYTAYDLLRRKYVGALVKELASALDGGPPLVLSHSLNASAWHALRARVTGALQQVGTVGEAQVAADQYRSALHVYLDGMVASLGSEIRFIKREALARGQKFQTDHPGLVSELDGLAEKVHQINVALSNSDLRSAWNEVGDSLAELRDLKSQLDDSRKGVAELHLAGAGVLERVPGGAPPTAAVPIERVPPPRLSPLRPSFSAALRQLDLRILLADVFVSGCALFVAVAWGQSLLWNPNLSWGATGDLTAAVLWGLGVQTVAGSGFKGLAGFRDSLGG